MSRKIRSFVNKLITVSLQDGKISDERVSAVLLFLKNNPCAHHKEILQTYLLKLKKALRWETILLESSTDLESSVVENIKSQLSAYYNKNLEIKTILNSSLISGFRVWIGDDVWDASVQGKLKKFASKFTY